MPELTYSVSQVSLNLKQIVEQNFSNIIIKGEISGLTIASSGHAYFNLKENRDILACTCWKGVKERISIKLEEGIEILAQGKLTTYSGNSRYQFNIISASYDGVGNLMKLLEERKERLSKEGLFAPEYKKSIPKFPKSIGIITSSTGAVLQDILHRMKNRYAICKVFLYSISVQGINCAINAIEGIKYFIRYPVDIIIIARGGGSVEDLWEFNNEELAREVFNSSIPIISAIGHETDFTILDFVADLRAPTPTAAVELSVPDQAALFQEIRSIFDLCQMSYTKKIQNSFNLLYQFTLIQAYVEKYISHMIQRVDMILLDTQHFLLHQYSKIAMSEVNTNFLKKISEYYREKLFHLWNKCSEEIYEYIKIHLNNIENLFCNISAYADIDKILSRGFSIVQQGGNIILNEKDIKKIEPLGIRLYKGNIIVQIIK